MPSAPRTTPDSADHATAHHELTRDPAVKWITHLSNLLCQLYRLSELVKHEFGDPTRFHDALRATPDHCAARAAMWVRNFDTHQTVVVADMDDSFTDYFTEMFGTLVWRPLADLPEQRSNYGRADYDAQLAGQPVLDTARRAFDTLAAMV